MEGFCGSAGRADVIPLVMSMQGRMAALEHAQALRRLNPFQIGVVTDRAARIECSCTRRDDMVHLSGGGAVAVERYWDRVGRAPID